MTVDDTWFPPTAQNPLPVNVVAVSAPNVKSWYPPSGQAPLPVTIIGNTGIIQDPPDTQLYGRRGPPGSGVWSLISLAAGPPEAPTTGGIFGRGQVAASQVWTPVLPLAGGVMTGAVTLAADAAAPLQPATKQQLDNVGAVANNAVKKAGDVMSGFLTLVGDPTSSGHAATKNYADNIGAVASAAVQRAGDTMSGLLVLSGNATNPLGAATKQMVDAVSTVANAAVMRAGDTMGGLLVLSGPPTNSLGAVTKAYADAIGTTAAAAVRRAGDTMSGLLLLSGDPTSPLGAVTKQFADAIMAVAQDGVDIHGDTMTGVLTAPGVTITGTTPGQLIINRNTITPPLPSGIAQVPLWLFGANGDSSVFGLDAFSSPHGMMLRRANGTASVPTHLNAGDDFGRLIWRGYGSTGYTGTLARVSAVALESFTDASQGSYLLFQTVPIGGTSVNLTTAATLAATGLTVNAGLLVGAAGTPNGPNALLTINRNAAAPTLGPTAGTLWANGADNEFMQAFLDSHGGATLLALRRANGPGAAPSRVNNGEGIGTIAFMGYGATGYQLGSGTPARIQALALEDFTDTQQGANLAFQTRPAGSGLIVTQMTVGAGVVIGAAGTPGGAGTLICNMNPTTGWPIVFSTAPLQVQGNDGAATNPVIVAFGGNCNLNFNRAQGTAASPTALTSGASAARIQVNGHDGAGWRTNTAYLQFTATENWDATHIGMLASIGATPTGGTATAAVATFQAGVQIGAPTGGDKGAATLNATGVYAGGVLLTSDARLKRDIAPLPGCLDLVGAIEPQQFRFIEPPPPPPRASEDDPAPAYAGPPGWFERKRFGFVSQEVEAAMRQAGFECSGVVDIGPDGVQSLSLGDLMAVLWQAVRELRARVDYPGGVN